MSTEGTNTPLHPHYDCLEHWRPTPCRDCLEARAPGTAYPAVPPCCRAHRVHLVTIIFLVAAYLVIALPLACVVGRRLKVSDLEQGVARHGGIAASSSGADLTPPVGAGVGGEVAPLPRRSPHRGRA